MILHIPIEAYGQALSGVQVVAGTSVSWDFTCEDPNTREPLDLSPVGTALHSSLCALDLQLRPIQPPVLTKTATITDAVNGLASVAWAADDTVPSGTPLDPGIYQMDLWIDDGSGNRAPLLASLSVEIVQAETLP